MSEPVFIVAAALVCGTLLMMVKIIAAATTVGKDSHSGLAELRERQEHQAVALEEAQAALELQSGQLSEMQERLDFAERLLVQSRDRESLGPGDPGR